MCPSHKAMNVKITPGVFNNVASFDNFVKQQLQNSPSYVSQFQRFYDCPKWTGTFERYKRSLVCSFLVQQSPCQQTQQVQPLCRESCLSFIDSNSKIFANTTACNPKPTPDVRAKRDTLINDQTNQYLAFCNRLQPKSAQPRCRDGERPEAATCGFLTAAEAFEQCSKNLLNDPCCADFANGEDLVLVSNHAFIAVGIVSGLVGIFIVAFKQSQYFNNTYYSGDMEKQESQGKFISGIGNSFPATTSKEDEAVLASTPKSNAISASPDSVASSPYKSNIPQTHNQTYNTANDDKDTKKNSPKTSESGISLDEEISEENPLQVIAIENYYAALEDEISLEVVNVLRSFEVFDDGWALGENITTGKTGTFPLKCTDLLGEFEDEDQFSSRKSSSIGYRSWL